MPSDERRPAPPTDVDRLAASRAAVAARRARARIKSDIAAGHRSPLDVLDTAFAAPDGTEGRLRVTEFLLSLPAIGQTKMRAALAALGISEVKRLGGLGVHQRHKLREFVVSRWHVPVARLTVLAGPTAVGKGTVAGVIRRDHPEIALSVSATTRPPRPGEVEGVNYYFVSDAEFDRMVSDGELLEWAIVHNAYRYGTPRRPIDRALAAGRSVLLEIDLQGARNVRAAMPDARLIFLMPPSWEELVRRLAGRDTEDSLERQRRLETAKVELAARDEFDHVVVNHDVSAAVAEVVDLITAHASDGAMDLPDRSGRHSTRRPIAGRDPNQGADT